jgi:peroxisomal membrane protein 2
VYTSLALEGRSWAATKQLVAKDYWRCQKSGWRLWPLASLINYRYVPLQFRVLFVNLVSLGWSTFLLWRMTLAPKASAS